MKKKSKKLVVTRPPRTAGGETRAQRHQKNAGQAITKTVRRDSNFTVLQESIAHNGSVRLRFQLQIKPWAPNTQYCGYQGTGIMFDAPTVATAEQFKEEILAAATGIATKLKFQIYPSRRPVYLGRG